MGRFKSKTTILQHSNMTVQYHIEFARKNKYLEQ